MLKTPSQIIDDKGGPAKMAALVGKRPGAIRAWKHRDTFPREAWPEIMQAFPELTLDALIAIEASRRPSRSAAA